MHLKRNASIIERTISFCPLVNPTRQQLCEAATRFCLLKGESRDYGQLYGAALFRLCARVRRLRKATGTRKSRDPVVERLKSLVQVPTARTLVVPYPALEEGDMAMEEMEEMEDDPDSDSEEAELLPTQRGSSSSNVGLTLQKCSGVPVDEAGVVHAATTL